MLPRCTDGWTQIKEGHIFTNSDSHETSTALTISGRLDEQTRAGGGEGRAEHEGRSTDENNKAQSVVDDDTDKSLEGTDTFGSSVFGISSRLTESLLQVWNQTMTI